MKKGSGLEGKGEGTVRRNREWGVEKLRKIPKKHRQRTVLREVTEKREKQLEIDKELESWRWDGDLKRKVAQMREEEREVDVIRQTVEEKALWAECLKKLRMCYLCFLLEQK